MYLWRKVYCFYYVYTHFTVYSRYHISYYLHAIQYRYISIQTEFSSWTYLHTFPPYPIFWNSTWIYIESWCALCIVYMSVRTHTYKLHCEYEYSLFSLFSRLSLSVWILFVCRVRVMLCLEGWLETHNNNAVWVVLWVHIIGI